MNKDIIFFFTDGISEAMNQHFQLFGEERIRRVIKDNADKTAAEIRTALLNNVTSFRGSASQNDDLTFVILKAD
jgi:sigma-B regulation protein RsbU (phosphoserine phosphatase)